MSLGGKVLEKKDLGRKNKITKKKGNDLGNSLCKNR